MKILIVEDNENLAFGLHKVFELKGYDARIAADGATGLDLAGTWAPDLVILDLMLPDMDGYRVLKTLREQGDNVLVLVLTARGEEADKVLGLNLGADDYVTKPFGRLELLARVEALFRRATKSADRGGGVQRFGEVEVDPAAHTVHKRGEPVELRPREFELLLALLSADGAVVSRLDLLRDVWGHRAAVATRTVDMHIANLRSRLEDDPAEPRHILTVLKAGYRLRR